MTDKDVPESLLKLWAHVIRDPLDPLPPLDLSQRCACGNLFSACGRHCSKTSG
jgi:hypothetical protein